MDIFLIESICVKQHGNIVRVNEKACNKLKILSKSSFEHTTHNAKGVCQSHLFKISYAKYLSRTI